METFIDIEGVMMDRQIYRKLKGKVIDYSVVPANTYGWETLALSELQQHKFTTSTREQLDKENSRCKESGERDNEIHKRSLN